MPKKKATKKKPVKKKVPSAETPAGEYPWIAEDLWPLAVPVEGLEVDPRNARTHDAANVKAIAASLHRFGQRRPIVVNRKNNQVEAGNGTLLAARELGWSDIAVVWVEDDESAQVGYSIADNRTAELAGWNNQLLAELLDQHAASAPEFFGDLRLAEILDQQAAEASELPGEASTPDEDGDEVKGKSKEAPAEVIPDTWSVVVECDGEDDQKELFERMQKEGRKCRLLTL